MIPVLLFAAAYLAVCLCHREREHEGDETGGGPVGAYGTQEVA